MTDKDRLLKDISMHYFAALETEMFLDMHPRDCAALKARRQFREKYNCLVDEYQKRYGMLTKNAPGSQDRWTWVDNPWPWE